MSFEAVNVKFVVGLGSSMSVNICTHTHTHTDSSSRCQWTSQHRWRLGLSLCPHRVCPGKHCWATEWLDRPWWLQIWWWYSGGARHHHVQFTTRVQVPTGTPLGHGARPRKWRVPIRIGLLSLCCPNCMYNVIRNSLWACCSISSWCRVQLALNQALRLLAQNLCTENKWR